MVDFSSLCRTSLQPYLLVDIPAVAKSLTIQSVVSYNTNADPSFCPTSVVVASSLSVSRTISVQQLSVMAILGVNVTVSAGTSFTLDYTARLVGYGTLSSPAATLSGEIAPGIFGFIGCERAHPGFYLANQSDAYGDLVLAVTKTTLNSASMLHIKMLGQTAKQTVAGRSLMYDTIRFGGSVTLVSPTYLNLVYDKTNTIVQGSTPISLTGSLSGSFSIVAVRVPGFLYAGYPNNAISWSGPSVVCSCCNGVDCVDPNANITASVIDETTHTLKTVTYISPASYCGMGSCVVSCLSRTLGPPPSDGCSTTSTTSSTLSVVISYGSSCTSNVIGSSACNPGFVFSNGACVPFCLVTPCVHGVCISDSSIPFCACNFNPDTAATWTGALCDTPSCPLNCIGAVYGTCDPTSLDAYGAPQCSCNPQFTGVGCEIAICPGGCLNDGQCLESAGSPRCFCPITGSLAYYGSQCQFFINSTVTSCTPECKAPGGNCTDGKTCTCNPDWTGFQCSIPTCSSLNGCSSNGVCIWNSTKLDCQCVSSFQGSGCSIATFAGLLTTSSSNASGTTGPSSSSSSRLSDGAIAGIAVGITVLVGVAIGVSVMLFKRHMEKKRELEMRDVIKESSMTQLKMNFVDPCM